MTEPTNDTLLPFDELGGAPVVSALVERFYDLMESDPRFAQLRSIHGADLMPIRASLTGFLTAWLGGPRDWFVQRPGACIMSAHRQLGFDASQTDQWTAAMAQALCDIDAPPALTARLNEAFLRMGRAMQRTE